MSPLVAEVVGLFAQGLTFAIGLALSIVVGMVLASALDGPGGLLIATAVSCAGLLSSAVLSQYLRDRLLERSDAPPPPSPSR
jgi:hypothetical protein